MHTDITTMGGKLFKKMVAAARLKNWELKKPDRVPRIYDRKEFHTWQVQEIVFDGKVLCTPIYIKMDDHELSGVVSWAL